MQRENVLQIYLWDRRYDRFGAGSNKQLVVIEPRVAALAISADPDAFPRTVNFQGFGLSKDLHVFHLLEESWIADYADRRGHQVFLFLDQPGNVIG